MPHPSVVDRPVPAAARALGKLHPFWALQIFGWSAYFLVHLAVLASEGSWNARILYGYACATLAGFLITLLMRSAYRRLARANPGWSWILVLLLGSFVGANTIMITADVAKLLFWSIADVFPPPRLIPYLQRLYWWLLYCTAWSVLYLGYQFWKAWKVREQRTANALALADAAQIQMLRYRLNPDFLFKALAGIRELITRDRKQARSLITELSEYLRYGLVSREHTEVPLSEELEAVRHFLAVRCVISESRLRLVLDMDPGAESCPIPPFTVVPLVETVAEDGLRANTPPEQVRVAVRLRPAFLRVEVGNPGSLHEFQSDLSLLPANLDGVRRRLEETCGSKCRFEVRREYGRVISAVVQFTRVS